MNCCEKCFKDIELKAIIKGYGKKGNCDFFGSKNTYISDVAKSDEIKYNFERLIDIYSSENSRPNDYPKEKNRFHTNIINKHVLSKVLQASFKKYKKGQVFYRARNCQNENGYTKKEMGAPPFSIASSGRANPEGISCLYLADSIDTTLHEIRAGIYDYVTVGKFVLQEDIEVVNLADIDKISPFKDLDVSLIAVNIPHLIKIGQNIAKPSGLIKNIFSLPVEINREYIAKKRDQLMLEKERENAEIELEEKRLNNFNKKTEILEKLKSLGVEPNKILNSALKLTETFD